MYDYLPKSNYIPEKHEMLCCRYADDVSASISFSPDDDINEIKMKITRCLNDILHFSMSHGLALNPDKTCGVIIGKQKIRDKVGKFEMSFDGNPIDFKYEVQLLGCRINENLELNTFIEEKWLNAEQGLQCFTS